MPHKSKNIDKDNSISIMITISVLGLALVTTPSLSHSYAALAASKKKVGSTDHINGITDIGSISRPTSSSISASSNALTNKQLSSFISCIKTANKSEGLTYKVFRNCLDIAKTKTPTLSLLLSLPDKVGNGLQNSNEGSNNNKW